MNEGYPFALLLVSDKACGNTETPVEKVIREQMENAGFSLQYRAVLPREQAAVEAELIVCADERKLPLVLTAGGTSFALRDVVPEATLAVIDREVRGIPEAMRAAGMKYTQRACLSRGVAGLRGGTLMINLPGSENAAAEDLAAITEALQHAMLMLTAPKKD